MRESHRGRRDPAHERPVPGPSDLDRATPPPAPGPQRLLLSVWFEGPGWGGFRARVSSASQSDGALETVTVTADPATVTDAVSDWIWWLFRQNPP